MLKGDRDWGNYVPPYERDEKWGSVIKYLHERHAGSPLPNWALIYLANSGLLRIYDPNFQGVEGFPRGLDPKLIGTDSIDLTLGGAYFRKERRLLDVEMLDAEGKPFGTTPALPSGILLQNEGEGHYYTWGQFHFLGNKHCIATYFKGPYEGVEREKILEEKQVNREIKEAILESGVPKGARIIVIEPEDELLCHTQQFVGAENYLSGILSTKSKYARQGITTHADSLAVKTGFRGRLTLEVRNWDQDIPEDQKPLEAKRGGHVSYRRFKVVWEGMPVLSIQFNLNSGFDGNNNSQFGNPGFAWEEIINNWKPEDMLP